MTRAELLSITASSLRLKTQLLSKMDQSQVKSLQARLVSLTLENIECMSVLDLVQFTHLLHQNVNKIDKIEYKLGLQFVDNAIMEALLAKFSQFLAA